MRHKGCAGGGDPGLHKRSAEGWGAPRTPSAAESRDGLALVSQGGIPPEQTNAGRFAALISHCPEGAEPFSRATRADLCRAKVFSR